MLKRNHKVLEIGCGAGRIANGLFHYLNQEGKYLGLDVHPEIIDWCKKFITTRNSNFQFKQLTLSNNYYYQKNNNKFNQYNFDFLGEQKFDCIFAVATFNHLRLEDTQQYLQQIGKRLKNNGVAYFTCFIIDEEFFEFQEKNNLHRGLKQDSAGVWYGYERQSSFTGYEIPTLKYLLDDANLKIITYHPGSWAQKKRSRLYQDWLLVEKNN
jgi:cyclopropane fatty-acyl-phospholipid synthase-like methyltransferase